MVIRALALGRTTGTRAADGGPPRERDINWDAIAALAGILGGATGVIVSYPAVGSMETTALTADNLMR